MICKSGIFIDAIAALNSPPGFTARTDAIAMSTFQGNTPWNPSSDPSQPHGRTGDQPRPGRGEDGRGNNPATKLRTPRFSTPRVAPRPSEFHGPAGVSERKRVDTGGMQHRKIEA